MPEMKTADMVQSQSLALCQQGQNLLPQGHVTQALKSFEQALLYDSRNFQARMGRAVCLFRLGRLLEAEIELRGTLNLDPQNASLKNAYDYARKFRPTLQGDRDIEWGWSKKLIAEFAKGQCRGAKLLDFGCGQTAELTRFAAQHGFEVTAIDMMPLKVSLDGQQKVHFIQGEFLQQNWPQHSFDLIINCSSVEHSGLPGRYGVVADDPDADLKIMAKMTSLLRPAGKMLLVVPIGKDQVTGSLHRVYGQKRLGQLLRAWQIEKNWFWIKGEDHKWWQADRDSALQRDGSLCYGIGCFVLSASPAPVSQIAQPFSSDMSAAAWSTSRIGLFDEEPSEILQAKELVKSYYQKRLKDIWHRPDHPVWFDHEIDYRMWPGNLFWIERGVRGRMPMYTGCRVLDLCCGDGYYSDVWFSTIAGSIDACDNDADALRFASQKHANPKVSYHFLDILTDPFPGPKYDVITWFGAIEHFSEERIVYLLRKIHDSLEDNGILVGSTPLVPPRSAAEKTAANRQHDREFTSPQDLEGVLNKVFANVETSVAQYPGRTTCYFQATKTTDDRKSDYIKDSYEKVWRTKLNDEEWLRNDGKGRVEHAANYLREKFLPATTHLLDIGCGRGTLALFLKKDWEFFGIDISQKAIKEARQIYKEALCVDMNCQNIPYPDGLFDIVTLLDVIEHVFDPPFLLREIYRVLKPGGELVLATPNILCQGHLNTLTRQRRFPRTSGDKFPYDGGHIHFFTYRDCFELLTTAGFQNMKPIGFMQGAENFEFKESSIWISAIK